ncbi:MAG: YaaR family protein [Peptococcaceae bacterium]|nr:YaaR family protein [Peptococcaceae bacterium]
MRVNPTEQSPSVGSAGVAASDKSRIDFSTMLTKTQKLQQQDLGYFLTQLDEQGQKLAKSLTPKDLLKFKSMIQTFLQSTFGQSRQMQEESSWDFRGQPRVMARVTKINQTLEELGREVLSNQAEPMEILNKIDEIKGLIIDIFG